MTEDRLASPPDTTTWRFRFSKLGKVRFTSHRDVARMWERALRRGGFPVAYTGGFSPRPQLSFGLALPTGCESIAEYLDVSFTEPPDPDGLGEQLEQSFPQGISVLAWAPVAGGGSLQHVVDGCSWEIEVPGTSLAALQAAVEGAMAADSIPIRRERKARLVDDDLRPSLLTLHVVAEPGAVPVLLADVATRPRGVRPAELAAGLGLTLGRARRTCQWIERGGSREEPLPVPAADAAVLERAR